MQWIMHDTDMGGDSDDMAEAYLLNTLWQNGECELLSETVVQNLKSGVRCEHYAQCLEIAHNWFSMFYVPMGSLKSRDLYLLDTYASTIASEYAGSLRRYMTEGDVPNALTVMRQALAGAADGSVHMVTTGTLTNLRLLYESPADDISPLTGAELMRLKLNELIITLGTAGIDELDPSYWPEGDDVANLPGDTWAAQVVNSLETDTAIKVVWVDLGWNIKFNVSSIAMNPLKRAVQLWAQDPPGSWQWHSWGPLAVLYAARGLSWDGTEYFHYEPQAGTGITKGSRHYTAPGHLLWTYNESRNQYWLHHTADNATLSAIVTALVCTTPTHLGTQTPYLATIVPSEAYGDEIDPTVLTGKLFTGATAVDMGDGITIDSFVVDSDSQITIHAHTETGAPTGLRDVSVTIPTGTGTRPDFFEVLFLDCTVDLSFLDALFKFKEVENIGTWGVDIDLTCLAEYTPVDGDAVTFQVTAFTPSAWNTITFQVGTSLQVGDIGLNCDWILEAFETALALDVTPTDLWLMIPSFYYEPPLGDWVNFQLTPYTPVAYNEVNWFWPLHCYLDFTDAVDADSVFNAITLLTEQFLSMTELPVALTFPAIDLYLVFWILNDISVLLADGVTLADATRMRLPYAAKISTAPDNYSLGDVSAEHDLGTCQEGYSLGTGKGGQG